MESKRRNSSKQLVEKESHGEDGVKNAIALENSNGMHVDFNHGKGSKMRKNEVICNTKVNFLRIL